MWTRLGEISQVKGGKRLPKGHDYSETPTNYPYIRVTDFEKMNVNIEDLKFLKPETQQLIDKYTISKEDVYISIAGSIGKVGLIPDKLDGANLTENAAKITNLNGIDKKFLSHVLNFAPSQEQIKTLTISSNQPKLALFRIEQIQIPLPPLPEQRRIVTKLEELFTRLDAGVSALKKTQAQLKRYRQSVLKAACEGKLVPTEAELTRAEGRAYETAEVLLARILKERREKWNGKGKYKEPAAPDTSGLPEGWCWARWHQISEWVTYGFTRPMPHVEEGIPIVTAKHVIKSKIDYINTHKTTNEAFGNLTDKDKPKSGDILITKDGTIGRAAIVENSEPFCINQSVAVIWLRSCPIERRYLLAVIESPITQKSIYAKARGVAIKHLSITDFAKMPFLLPPSPSSAAS